MKVGYLGNRVCNRVNEDGNLGNGVVKHKTKKRVFELISNLHLSSGAPEGQRVVILNYGTMV